MADDRKGTEESKAKRRLEAVAAVIGAVLAVATLAIIVWDGMQGGAPPVVTARAGEVHPHGDGYVLEIVVKNEGGQPAAQVMVEGELTRDGETVATSETTFDYVPRAAEREGGLFFTEDPRNFEVVLRAHGYIDP